MLNFNRNDRSGDVRAGDKGLAKPATADKPSRPPTMRRVIAWSPTWKR